MKINYFVILYILSTILLSKATAQDTLLFLNGTKMVLEQYNINDNLKSIMYEKKPGKIKQIELESLFSITDKKGYESIFYNTDSINGDAYSVSQMRSYIKGESMAIDQFHAPFCFITGLLVGVGSVYISPNPFYSPLIPTAYTALVGLTSPSEKKIILKNPQYANDPLFIEGYKEVAKSKRVKSTLKGALIGMAAGVLTGIAVGFYN